MSHDAEPTLTLLHRARAALVAVPLVMAAALTATVVTSYENVRHVLNTVTQSQADRLFRGMRGLLHSADEATAAELDRILEEHHEEGLRFVAVFDGERHVIASAGTSLGDISELAGELGGAEPRRGVDLGRRVRMIWQPPPRDHHGEPDHPAPPALVYEFEPLAANELRAGALQTLGIGGAVSLILVVTAAGLWRLTLRAERVKEARDRDRRLAALGELAAVISHEIRNPLTSMKGHAQLLAENLPAGSRDRDKAERVVREAIRLENLTTDLLSLVRTERVERRDVEPARLLREAVESMDGARVELDLAAAPPLWSLDPEKLHQVLTNLLRNAVQASSAGEPPVASIAVEQGRLVFTVRDHGEGIPAGEEERIFEPFYTTRVRGTGLGLAVARRIAALHGGTVTAANHPEGGAVFRVAIPA